MVHSVPDEPLEIRLVSGEDFASLLKRPDLEKGKHRSRRTKGESRPTSWSSCMWDGRLTKGTGFRLYNTYRELNKNFSEGGE